MYNQAIYEHVGKLFESQRPGRCTHARRPYMQSQHRRTTPRGTFKNRRRNDAVHTYMHAYNFTGLVPPCLLTKQRACSASITWVTHSPTTSANGDHDQHATHAHTSARKRGDNPTTTMHERRTDDNRIKIHRQR